MIQKNAVWASEGRGSFEAYVFLREVLKYCENKPEVVVDKGSVGFTKIEAGLKPLVIPNQRCYYLKFFILFEIKKMNTDTPPFLLETVSTVP